MYVATMQNLNYSRQDSKQEYKKHIFTLYFKHKYDFETRSRSSNLEKDVDPEQGYFNHAMFDRSRYNSIREKVNLNGCFCVFHFSNAEIYQ